MRYSGVLLIVTMTVALVATVLFFSFAPTQSVVAEPAPAQEAAVAAVDPAVAALYTERAAALQAQAEQLQLTIQERQATYAEQLATLTAAQAVAEEQLGALAGQEELLHQQLAEFTNVRASRGAQYDLQLQEARGQYDARAAAIVAQLQEAQARLAEANQLLGRQ